MDKEPSKRFTPGLYVMFNYKRLSDVEQQDYDQREQQAEENGDDGENGDFADPFEADFLFKDAVLVGPAILLPTKDHFTIQELAETTMSDDDDQLPPITVPYFDDCIALGLYRYQNIEAHHFSSWDEVLLKTGNRVILHPDFSIFRQQVLDGKESILNELAAQWEPDFDEMVMPGMRVEFYVDQELAVQELPDEVAARVFDLINKNFNCGRIVYGEGHPDVFRAWWRHKKE